MPYNFSVNERGILRDYATGGWSTAMDWNSLAPVTQVISGVTVRVYRDNSETTTGARDKLARLTDAIKALQDAGIMFADTDLAQFRVGLYNPADSGGESRGQVFMGVGTLPSVALMLGGRIREHIIPNGDDGAGGWAQAPARTIADRFYDYYKGTWVSETKRSGLAQTYHELGHIFHQLHSLEDFALNGKVAKAELDTGAAQTRADMCTDVQRAGTAHVSQYAGKGRTCLNEFVVEMFSGTMMGVDWSVVDPTGELQQLYDDLGGPALNRPRTIKRHRDFIRQRCKCPKVEEGFGWKRVSW